MKRILTALMTLSLTLMLIISCDTSTSGASSTATYTVTFSLNGGRGTFNPVTVEPGKTVDEPDNKPTMKNGVFQFWSKDGTAEFDFKTEITENVELKAVWKTNFELGDIGPAGGWIFYDVDADNNVEYDDEKTGAHCTNKDGLTSSGCGWRYLEAAPADLTGAKHWGSDGKTLGTEFGIGKGQSNTTALLNAKESDSTLSFPAAEGSASYGEDTAFDDWFLPSKDELHQMYVNLDVKGKGSFGDQTYWSSSASASSSGFAWYESFGSGNGAQYSGDAANGNSYVRPIRAFAEVGSSSGS